MIGKNDMDVHHPNLLRVMLQVRQWESRQLDVLQTFSGRELYLCLAASLLEDAKPQSFKSLQGQMTERATRQRIKAFEALGLIEVDSNQIDHRTKRAVPTKEFIRNLNQHLDLLMHLCEQEFVMISKK